MRHLVLGLGEVGSALLAVLRETYGEAVTGWDVTQGIDLYPIEPCDILHVCFPYNSELDVELGGQIFRGPANWCVQESKASLVIIHSTVPIGTTAKIPNAVHSPVLGKHPHLARDMRTFLKWIGGPRAEEAANILGPAGFRVRCVPMSEETEALKLLDLAKYGMSIAFSHYEMVIAQKLGFSFSDILEYDLDYNNHVEGRLRRPIIAPVQDSIGGHCVVPGVKLLSEDFPHEILNGILRYGRSEDS